MDSDACDRNQAVVSEASRVGRDRCPAEPSRADHHGAASGVSSVCHRVKDLLLVGVIGENAEREPVHCKHTERQAGRPTAVPPPRQVQSKYCSVDQLQQRRASLLVSVYQCHQLLALVGSSCRNLCNFPLDGGYYVAGVS